MKHANDMTDKEWAAELDRIKLGTSEIYTDPSEIPSKSTKHARDMTEEEYQAAMRSLGVESGISQLGNNRLHFNSY